MFYNMYGVFIKYCVFSPRNLNILRPILRQYLVVQKNGQPIRVTVHSDELLFYMQGMGCSELGKTFLKQNVAYGNLNRERQDAGGSL